MGVEESSNVIARILFVLIVTSNRAVRPRVNISGYCRGGILPAKRQQKEEISSKIRSADSLVLQRVLAPVHKTPIGVACTYAEGNSAYYALC